MTTTATFREVWALQASEQEAINAMDIPEAQEALMAHAIGSHAEYPQYDGYWEGWTAKEVTRTIRYKGGDILAGDKVLMSTKLSEFRDPIVYSARKAGNSSIPFGVLK